MAKKTKKAPKEASNLFQNIIKASVSKTGKNSLIPPPSKKDKKK